MDPGILRAHGRRLTPQRELILRLIEGCPGHIAPDDIYQRVHAEFPMVNRSTISRTLDVLEDLGIVRHVHDGDGSSRYHLGQGLVHLHLFCHRCGHLAEVDDVTVADPLVRTLKKRFGFDADPSHFAISGKCAACS